MKKQYIAYLFYSSAILFFFSACTGLFNQKTISASRVDNVSVENTKTNKNTDRELLAVASELSNEMDRSIRLAPPGSRYAKRFNTVTEPHMKEDGLDFNFKVISDSALKIYGLPNGSVRISSGLMDLLNDDELRFMTAYQIGHIQLGHSANALRALLDTAEVKAKKQTDRDEKGYDSELLEKLRDINFSGSEVLEADRYAVSLMKRHGYKLDAVITCFNKLAGLKSDGSGSVKIPASYPVTSERAENLASITSGSTDLKIADLSKTRDSGKSGTTAPPKPSPSAKKTPPSGALKGGKWYVQVLSTTDKKAALSDVGRLKDLGFSSFTEVATVRGTEYNRVMVGPFVSKIDAEDSIQSIRDSGITKEKPFSRYVAEETTSRAVEKSKDKAEVKKAENKKEEKKTEKKKEVSKVEKKSEQKEEKKPESKSVSKKEKLTQID